jgi:hypothetical protein
VQCSTVEYSEYLGDYDHILLSHIRDFSNLEGQIPVFISPPQEQGGPVIPPGTGFPFRRLLRLSVSESEPYVTTDGQSASLSWNKAPIWGLLPDFYYCQTVAVVLIRALSLTRGRICRLQLLLALSGAVILES